MINESFWIGTTAALLIAYIFETQDFDNPFAFVYEQLKRIPYIPRTTKYKKIVDSLCRQYNIKCDYRYEKVIGQANHETNVIKIPYPNTLTRLTTALHEIGHLVHPAGGPTPEQMENSLIDGDVFFFGGSNSTSYTKLKYEICAWLWAFRNKEYPINKKYAKHCLDSYLMGASVGTKKKALPLLLRLNRVADYDFIN